MKGNGNGWSTLFQKLYFMLLPSSGMRTKYIIKHAYQFWHIGGGIFWQPRTFPTDPELISIGDNVMIASNVHFINHDIISQMLNRKYKTHEFEPSEGCISIGDNVMIGSGVVILPNTRIGSNVVIGSGAVVTKDIPDNSVAAGVPCRVVGEFEKLVEKYRNVRKCSADELWKKFDKEHL